MKKRSIRLASLLFICFASSTMVAQITSPKIDALMEDALTKFKVAGAAIAIVKDGKVIHQKGYGLLLSKLKKL